MIPNPEFEFKLSVATSTADGRFNPFLFFRNFEEMWECLSHYDQFIMEDTWSSLSKKTLLKMRLEVYFELKDAWQQRLIIKFDSRLPQGVCQFRCADARECDAMRDPIPYKILPSLRLSLGEIDDS